MNVIRYLIVVILITSCIERKHENDAIIGKWYGESSILVSDGDTVDYTKDQKGYENKDIRIFNPDGTYFVSYFGTLPFDTGTYSISKDVLHFGKGSSPIVTLNDSILIYKFYYNEFNSYVGKSDYFIMGFRKEGEGLDDTISP